MIRATAAALAALALGAAPAAAAPARTTTFSNDVLTPFTWSFGPGTGVLGDATVAENAPCTEVLQTCDTTLVHLVDPGTLSIQTSTKDQTLVDVDAYLFESDETGAQGTQITSGVTFSPNESIGAFLDAGYYLVRVDYMTGVGTYDGVATFTLPEPEEDEPESE